MLRSKWVTASSGPSAKWIQDWRPTFSLICIMHSVHFITYSISQEVLYSTYCLFRRKHQQGKCVCCIGLTEDVNTSYGNKGETMDQLVGQLSTKPWADSFCPWTGHSTLSPWHLKWSCLLFLLLLLLKSVTIIIWCFFLDWTSRLHDSAPIHFICLIFHIRFYIYLSALSPSFLFPPSRSANWMLMVFWRWQLSQRDVRKVY